MPTVLLKPPSCGGCPLYEPPSGKRTGFSVPHGTGKSGVFVVAEALGEQEEKEGCALVGPVGRALWQQLARVDITRDDLTTFNTIACRPPNNKLDRMPWEKGAISHCAPNLEKAIADAREIAITEGKTFVIVTVGKIAFKRIMGLEEKDALLKYDYIAYPFWSDRYRAWVLACDHPSYLMRGKTELWPTVQFVFTRALEIASHGFSYETPDYYLDPDPKAFYRWAEEAVAYLKAHRLPLSHDIETPYKKKTDEDDLGKEEDQDHTILRVSFCYIPNRAVSVRWNADYLAGIELLYREAPILLGWNSDNYDLPRITRHVRVNGENLDAMVAWHILNTALPKGLGFVTPFIVQHTGMWKHLSDEQPAFYNAKDADMALRIYQRVEQDLHTNHLWDVFQHHVLDLNKALRYMSAQGVLRDEEARNAAEEKLSGILKDVEAQMEFVVPQAAKKFQVYKNRPKHVQLEEMVMDVPVKYCGVCGLHKPTKTHAKHCPNWTVVELLEPRTVWRKPLPFKVSKQSLLTYQQVVGHDPIVEPKEKKITFNEDAIVKLLKKYKGDQLYPLILDHREAQKLLSTYIGITQYEEIVVPDDYQLQPGEKLKDAI